MIICITGLARSGKDYVANLIQTSLNTERKAIATNLKIMLSEALSMSVEELDMLKNTNPEYRQKLQRLGTRINELSQNAQVEAMYRTRDKTKTLLVTDLRLKTELAYLKTQDTVILIQVKDFNQQYEDKHVSENDLRYTEPDYLIDNTNKALTKQHVINIVKDLALHNERINLTAIQSS
jgi:cytidylate kinase